MNDYKIEVTKTTTGDDYVWRVYYVGALVGAGMDPTLSGAEFCAVGCAAMHEERTNRETTTS